MKRKPLIIGAIFLAIGLTAFLSGPVPPDPTYTFKLPEVSENLYRLESKIEASESSHKLRENNHARIIWHHETKTKTEYSIVYLHGFAGSFMDGYPLNKNIADSLGANLYLTRMAGHGKKPAYALENFTAENAWQSAKKALAIGEQIGEKVILMSTSTGGTLSLFLAAHYPDRVAGLINISPNIKDDQFGAFLLNTPWGMEIAHLVSLGEHKKIEHESNIASQYWDTIYPAEALVNLQVLVNSTMTESTFKNVKCPVLTMFYYEDFWDEDEHVEVSVYDEKHKLLGTPEEEVDLVALDEPKTHFIGSAIKSEDYKTAQNPAITFIREHIMENQEQ